MKKSNKLVLSVLAVCIGFSGYTLASNDGYGSNDNPSYDNKKQPKGKAKGHYKAKYKKYSKAWYEYHYGNYHPYEKGTEKRLALNLVGKGPMYPSYVPDIDGDDQPDPASCFDVELKTIADGELVGTATDCLSNVLDGENGGLKLVGTTFFNLPDGQIVTRGLTTVQPVNQKTVTPDGKYITHITGASSKKNGVLKATGDYKWYRGPVRLSGMVNLSKFFGNVGEPIFFDCLFTLDLKKINTKHPYWFMWYKHYFHQDYYAAHNGYGSSDDSSSKPYEEPHDAPYDDPSSEPYDEPDEDPYDDSYEGSSGDHYDDSHEGSEEESYYGNNSSYESYDD